MIETIISVMKLAVLALILFCGICWIHHYNLDAKGWQLGKQAFVASFPAGTFK